MISPVRSTDLRMTGRCIWLAGRHVDEQVAEHLAPRSRGGRRLERAAAVVRVLGGADRRQVVGIAGDAVLGELAERRHDLATTADAAAAAHRVEVDAELARRVEHGATGFDVAAAAGWGEDDGGHGRRRLRSALRVRPVRPSCDASAPATATAPDSLPLVDVAGIAVGLDPRGAVLVGAAQHVGRP